MAQVQLVKKPRKWDAPFGQERMRPDVVSTLLSLPFFRDIDEGYFPEDLTLAAIVANDGRILRYNRGDIVYRQGEYSTSVFVILSGSIRSTTSRQGEQAISLALANSTSGTGVRHDGFMQLLGYLRSILKPEFRINNIDSLVAEIPADAMGPDNIFGECEALTRGPRANTHFAGDDETLILELRWPGTREIRYWSECFRHRMDECYRQRSLWTGLRNWALFEHLSDTTVRRILDNCLFETYGSFDWTHRYQRDRAADKSRKNIIDHEHIIAEQGHYLDDILLIHAGFARMSMAFEQREKTVGYVTQGDVIGLEELKSSAGNDKSPRLLQSLRASGYTDLIRIPVHIVEKYVLAGQGFTQSSHAHSLDTGVSSSKLEFTVDNRFTNGTQVMVINLDLCVNCDDCVRACAASHDNIPRFVRRGSSHQNMMIAHACMHCVDPVCLIDCPTGAIHRDAETGNVVIDDATCIGCATCASACPYDNIRMEDYRNADGAFHIDADGIHISRATKCDLCTGRRGGPACQKACPHNALIRLDLKDACAGS